MSRTIVSTRAVFLCLIVCLPASLLLAAEPLPVDQVRAIAQREYPALFEFYQTLHRNPELSLAEEKTAARLAKQWQSLGYSVTERVGGHGVVAVLKNGDGKTLLLRTDMDALPVAEATGAPYASTVTTKDAAGNTVPVMHACGHDVHMTVMTGVARAMIDLKSSWKGTLILIGQPAEEVGKGAPAMLKDGLFTRFPRPDYCLALHVDAELETGKIGFVPGLAMANVDTVDILVRGVGGHGAAPHTTKDPIVLASEIVLALQTIASREIQPTDPVVVTVGSIHGGTKHNIIPSGVKLQLTIRTTKDDVRRKVLAAIERIAKGTAMAAGVPKELEPIVTVKDESFTALYNTPELVTRVTGALRPVLGTDNVVQKELSMGGEDFACYGLVEPRIPIFMYRLGSVTPQRLAESKQPGGPHLPSLHSPLYLPDPQCIQNGVVSLTCAAVELLR